MDHHLVPPEFPQPSIARDWEVMADWWEEAGDMEKADFCRSLAGKIKRLNRLEQAARNADISMRQREWARMRQGSGSQDE